MLDEIRVKVMERIKNMRDFVQTWQINIALMVQSKLDINKEKACECSIIFNGEHGFEVVEGNYRHIVDLHKQICTCRYWELKGIPCAHAICAMYNRKLNPDSYVSKWFSKETYLKSYDNVLQPVLGMSMWPESDYPTIQPPMITKKPGRPKKQRRRDKDDPKKKSKFRKYSKTGVKMTCSICHSKGHNKTGCLSRGRPQPEVICYFFYLL